MSESTLPTVREFWEDQAERYDDDVDHGLRDTSAREAWRVRLSDWLPSEPATVLDLGCGTGSLARLALEAGHRVLGVDLAPSMVALAEQKCAEQVAGGRARFLVGDAAEPPVGAETFDVLLARHLLWTLPDPHAVLARWVGLVRPGGRLVLVEGRWWSAGDLTPYAQGTAGPAVAGRGPRRGPGRGPRPPGRAARGGLPRRRRRPVGPPRRGRALRRGGPHRLTADRGPSSGAFRADLYRSRINRNAPVNAALAPRPPHPSNPFA